MSQPNYTQGSGYRVNHDTIDKKTCDEVFVQFTLELCFFLFKDHAPDLIRKYGMATTNLVNDPTKRHELGISNSTIRRNGNPVNPKF